MNHSFPFDPTYGYDEPRLRQVSAPEAPSDLARFWNQTHQHLRDIPLNLFRRPSELALPDRHVFEVEYDSLDGFRVGAWLTVPKDKKVRCGFVVGHGYGGRDAPEPDVPARAAAAIYPCARGFGLSRNERVPGEASRHVLHGIETRQTYVHRACVADLWAGASVLQELFPDIQDNLHYMGASFGGGIGAMAIAWDARFRKAFLDVPSFGHHRLRLECDCVGSGAAVREHHARRPDVLSVLDYFDAATIARHIRIPTLVAAARFDPVVPPPGQFAVFNAISGPKRLFVRQAAHFDFPGAAGEEARLQRWLRDWFDRNLE